MSRPVVGSLFFAITASAAAAAAAPALAHHSFAMFDADKTITISGTVKEFQWTNPHVWTQLMVPNARGGQDEWGIEHIALNNLARRGWSRQTFKPGDKLTMVINPIKSGEKGGAFVSATMADGTIWTNNGPEAKGSAPAR